MLRFCLLLIVSWLLNGFVLGAEVGAKEKVYYKQSETTAAVESGHFTKDVIPIVMEGQPPSSQPIKLNTAKVREVKKESKIVPKKGVLDKSSEKLGPNGTLKLDSLVEKPIVEQTNKSAVVIEPNKQKAANIPIPLSTERTSTAHSEPAPVREEPQKQQVANDTEVKKPARKPKPKPLVTIGGKEADEPIPASPTNKSPLGMPRKIDYIVPVVITITALPLLGVAFYVLYRRGRDYWDKRHYRRMDFLIDGMYNE